MSCPHCRSAKSHVWVPVTTDEIACCSGENPVETALDSAFSFKVNVFSPDNVQCPDCGAVWKIESGYSEECTNEYVVQARLTSSSG